MRVIIEDGDKCQYPECGKDAVMVVYISGSPRMYCEKHADGEVRVKKLEEALTAAKSILWMAKEYSECGSKHSREVREYNAAMLIIEKVEL